jgi:hypothetical protein
MSLASTSLICLALILAGVDVFNTVFLLDSRTHAFSLPELALSSPSHLSLIGFYISQSIPPFNSFTLHERAELHLVRLDGSSTVAKTH